MNAKTHHVSNNSVNKNSLKIYSASDNIVNSTPRKISMVVQLIKNKKASVALNYLRFCNKKAAYSLAKCLSRAVADAENNFNANIDSLYISDVLVGKSITLKRWRARAKGRGVRILKRYGKIKIKLKEKEE